MRSPFFIIPHSAFDSIGEQKFTFNMRIISAFLAVALWLNTAAEIRINEVAASNVRSFPNAEEFEDYPDWIELSNTSSKPESLNGYYLSDDPTNLKKWPFPRNSTINPFEHLVIVADGYDKPRNFPVAMLAERNSQLNSITQTLNSHQAAKKSF